MSRRRGLGNPSGVVAYQRRPTITGLLDFAQKLHKVYYNEGCKKFLDGFAIEPEERHAFVTALTFKVKRFGWGGDACGILIIPTDEFTNIGGKVHKYLLESDGEFSLTFLRKYMETYINVPEREAQNDAMLFEAVIKSLSSDGKCKIYNLSKDFIPWAKSPEFC